MLTVTVVASLVGAACGGKGGVPCQPRQAKAIGDGGSQQSSGGCTPRPG